MFQSGYLRKNKARELAREKIQDGDKMMEVIWAQFDALKKEEEHLEAVGNEFFCRCGGLKTFSLE